MAQKPRRKGDFGDLKSKTFPRRACPQEPSVLETCAFGPRLGNRPVLILDPRPQPY